MAEPPITLQAVHDSGPPNLPPTRVVIHATAAGVGYPRASSAGMAASTARYFAGAGSGGSAHYVADVAGEEHCVPDSHIAWHAPPNARSLGIEICAEATYTREQWLSAAVWPAVVRAAARTVELCARHDIPLQRVSSAALLAGARGVCGHVDVSQAWHQSTHTDPGPNFPWPEFLAACHAATTTPRGENVLSNHRVTGTGTLRLICPVGKASGITARAWVSATVDGPATGSARVWIQDDQGGISDKQWAIPFADGHSARPWAELPDGATQVNVQYAFPAGGTVCLETLGK